MQDVLQDIDKFIYIGPSWAAQNYEPPGSIVADRCTNLAKEWNIPHMDLSEPGQSITVSLNLIKNLPDNDLPIVWIYGEPSMNFPNFGVSHSEFINRSDWRDVWDQCNQFYLESIDNLNKKILLFGAHSDLTDYKFKNVVVGHNSYQKFLASQLNLLDNNNNIVYNSNHKHDYLFKSKRNYDCIIKHCWGVDIVHKEIYHQRNIDPPVDLVDETVNMLNFWSILEAHGLFYDTHPTKKGIELFAKETKNTVLNFLKDCK